ncbi:MAG: SRPBCC family protein [Chloroflexi bacterium]|nr:MAG: SRPBCC family protein [Chloroflexota bacterium]
MRVEASADVDVRPSELYAIAADLRNLPSWWIEHLSVEVTEHAHRSRDALYRVRYRLPGGLVISATCAVIANRAGSSLTYVWTGGGLHVAVGQFFVPRRDGCRTRLVADVTVSRRLQLLGPLFPRLMLRNLEAELQRAVATLADTACARTIVRRGSSADRSGASPRPSGRSAVRVRSDSAG